MAVNLSNKRDLIFIAIIHCFYIGHEDELHQTTFLKILLIIFLLNKFL